MVLMAGSFPWTSLTISPIHHGSSKIPLSRFAIINPKIESRVETNRYAKSARQILKIEFG